MKAVFNLNAISTLDLAADEVQLSVIFDEGMAADFATFARFSIQSKNLITEHLFGGLKVNVAGKDVFLDYARVVFVGEKCSFRFLAPMAGEDGVTSYESDTLSVADLLDGVTTAMAGLPVESDDFTAQHYDGAEVASAFKKPNDVGHDLSDAYRLSDELTVTLSSP